MLVEGRNIPFLTKRSANSIPVAFASPSPSDLSERLCRHHHCYHRPHQTPPRPPEPPFLVCEVVEETTKQKVIADTGAAGWNQSPPSFTGRTTQSSDHPEDPAQPSRSHRSGNCKLDIIIIITLLIITTVTFIFTNYNRKQAIQAYLLIIVLAISIYYLFYYCFGCCLRTPLLFSLSAFSCYYSSRFIKSTSITSKSQESHQHQRHKPSRSNWPSSSISLLRPIILFIMVGLAISANHGSAFASVSERHSNENGGGVSRTEEESSFSNEQLRQAVESQFLKMMGMKAVPRLNKHHKVPEYLLDLYAWFQQGDGDDSQLEWHGDSEDEAANNKRIVNSLFGLSTEDLKDVYQIEPSYRDEISNYHRRVPRRRRSTQSSRATLQGPSNTIISHKISEENLNPNRDAVFLSANQAHLNFDVHLPGDEILTGAELRIYRHSAYEFEDFDSSPSPATGSSSSNKLVPERPNTSKHNNFWPLYHWSVRYKDSVSSSTNDHQPPPPSPLRETVDNSHPTSGDEYWNQEENYLQRINIYHLLAPWDQRTPKTAKLIDTQVIDVRDSGWLSFDVFPAVEWWMKNQGKNHGLLVTLTDPKGRRPPPTSRFHHSQLFVLHPPSPPNAENYSDNDSHRQPVQSTSQIDADHPWHELQPLIITFSNTAHAQKHNLIYRERLLNRSKRDQTTKGGGLTGAGGGGQQRPRNRKKNKSSARRRDICRRHQLFFDFRKVGWMDWIVAPPGFQTYYCKGECSYPLSVANRTNHAIIQSLVNSVNPTVVPEPCCVPTDLAPVSLLYYDEKGKVVLKTYPDMIVEGCGCK